MNEKSLSGLTPNVRSFKPRLRKFSDPACFLDNRGGGGRNGMIDTITAGSALPQRKSASTDHMPSLDGLRAISIALVLLGHLSGTRGFVRLDFGIGDYAHLGVVVFFVISGFLITRLLISEH